MPKRTKKNRSNRPLVGLALVGLAVVGGLAYYVKNRPADKIPADLATPDYRQKQYGEAEREVKVLTPSMKGGDLHFKESVSKSSPNVDPMVFAVNEFLKASTVVDAQARVKSVKLDGGLATLDFTAAFEQTYGTEDERTILEGIRRAMGQFKDVQRIGFTVKGKPLDTIGNVELSEPLTVIR